MLHTRSARNKKKKKTVLITGSTEPENEPEEKKKKKNELLPNIRQGLVDFDVAVPCLRTSFIFIGIKNRSHTVSAKI